METKAIPALSPTHVAGYLRGTGWTDEGLYGPYGQLFSLVKESRSAEVVLPRSKTVDFGRRMIELVETLATVEGRDPRQVLFDLTLAPFDVVRVRSKDADDYGSIRFKEGIQLHEEAKNLLISASLAEASPRPRKAWKGRRPNSINQYVDHLRLGQTENASFSLTILSPYSFDPEEQAPLLEEDAFGRRVTRRLGAALTAVEAALADSVTDPVPAFEKTVREGVSAELCQSLAKIAGNDAGIEVSVSWSPAKPVSTPVRLHLTRQDASILKEVALTFARQEPEPDFMIEGLIEMITEKPEAFTGSVVVQAPLPGQSGVRKIRIRFDERDRTLVYEAARDKRWIRVTGELVRDRTNLSLLNPHDFEVLELS